MIALPATWALYFFLHSWLASVQPKKWFQKKFPHLPLRYYRIAYNIFSIAGLTALLYYQLRLPSKMLFPHSLFTYILGIILMTAGVIIMLIAGLHYDLKSFTGVTEERRDVLKKNKLNRFVRHPLYSGTTLFFFSFCILWPYYKNLFLFIIYLIYLGIGMYLEEKKLIQLYGDEYRHYQKKVKKITPYLW